MLPAGRSGGRRTRRVGEAFVASAQAEETKRRIGGRGEQAERGDDLRLRGGMYEAFAKESVRGRAQAELAADRRERSGRRPGGGSEAEGGEQAERGRVWPRPMDASLRRSPRAPRLSVAGRRPGQGEAQR